MAPNHFISSNTGPLFFTSSVIFSLASSFLLRAKSTKGLSIAREQLMKHGSTIPYIASGQETVAYWEKYDKDNSFLEEVASTDALSWVKDRNTHSIDTLGQPESSPLYSQVLAILNSKDKIPYVSKIGDHYYNFWQDEVNQRGLWRRTSMESFQTSLPEWETVIDIDQLGKKEGESWVYKGNILYTPDDKMDPMAYTRVLLQLSRGGADAVVIREFDLITKDFVSSENNAFVVPEAKSSATWKSENILLVGTDMKGVDGSDTTTDSGYPRVVYEWSRGTLLKDAVKVFEGEKSDVSVGAYVSKHRGYRVEIRYRSLTFYTSSKMVRIIGYPTVDSKLKEEVWVDLPVPLDMQVGMFADQILLKLRSDWKIGSGASEKLIPSGSLLSVSLEELIASGVNSQFAVIFTPSARISLSGYTKTKTRLILETLENVKSRLHFWNYNDGVFGGWSYAGAEEEATIKSTSVSAINSDESDDYWLITSSFTQPSALFFKDALSGPAGLKVQDLAVKSLPPQFNAGSLIETQFEATSKDGTKIPYFCVFNDKKGTGFPPTDGLTPTLLYGYGGFEISLTPSYAAVVGAGWLERGGCYVSANIRGGGEFGPQWHQAAKKENRQLAYDDFIAVAEDLIRRGITTSEHLGIRGGSNGGMLMGNMIVQRPDLFGAVCCAVPLLDMKIYHRLLAGNSWMAEYGDPSTEDWKFLQAYSPYHNISPNDPDGPLKGTKYPPLLMTTSTRDDRVHPYHARAFVKRLLDVEKTHGETTIDNTRHDANSKDFGNGSVYYYENMEGGHGGAADNKQQAFMNVLYLDFLWKTIGPK